MKSQKSIRVTRMAETKLILREISIPQLPEDVVADILSRLSVKHLLQLKCVCKPWRSLISDPHFAKLQLAQSKNLSNHTLLCLSDPLRTLDCKDSGDSCEYTVGHLEYPAVMEEIPGFYVLRNCISVQGSCNGLICVTFPDGRIFVWNPTIREALELPNKNGDFDQKHYHVLGLGYDFSINDYKVLRSRQHFRLSNCEILALKSNVWRKVEKYEPESYWFLSAYPGIFLRGALHWLLNKPTDIIVILAFDIVEEKFFELVGLPDNIDEKGFIDLRKSGDTLILLRRGFGRSYLEAWQLNEYGVKSSWTKIFSDRCTIPDFRYWGDVLCYTKTGKTLFEYAAGNRFWLAWYDPKEITRKTGVIQQIDSSLFRSEHALYVQSLVSLDWYRTTKSMKKCLRG